MTRSFSLRQWRLPRALQVLFLLVGVQVAARLWPVDAPVPVDDADAAAAAHAALQGVWVEPEEDVRVTFDADVVTLEQRGTSQQVGFQVIEVREDAVVLELAHDPVEQRVVCLFDGRLDLDCPTGIWLQREGA